MTRPMETLEDRRLFAATLPASVTATYAPVEAAILVTGTDEAAAVSSIAQSNVTLLADVKALGHNATIVTLLRHTYVASADASVAVTRQFGRYIAGAMAAFNHLQQLDAVNTTNPTTATARRYAAARARSTTVEAARLAGFRAHFDRAFNVLTAAQIVLASSTAASAFPTLQVAVRSSVADQQAVADHVDSDIVALSTAITAVLGDTTITPAVVLHAGKGT